MPFDQEPPGSIRRAWTGIGDADPAGGSDQWRRLASRGRLQAKRTGRVQEIPAAHRQVKPERGTDQARAASQPEVFCPREPPTPFEALGDSNIARPTK